MAAHVALILFVGVILVPGLAWWLPHGPVLIYAGLAAYGVAMARERSQVTELPELLTAGT